MNGAAHGMFSHLGSALRLLREAAGLSQGALAQKAGMGKSQHRAEISPATLLVTTARPHDDPALESFRRLFGHFLESFEILITSRLLQSPHSSDTKPRS